MHTEGAPAISVNLLRKRVSESIVPTLTLNQRGGREERHIRDQVRQRGTEKSNAGSRGLSGEIGAEFGSESDFRFERVIGSGDGVSGAELAVELIQRRRPEGPVESAATAPLLLSDDEPAAGREERILLAGGMNATASKELQRPGLHVALQEGSALPLNAAAIAEAGWKTGLDAVAFGAGAKPC